MYSMFSTSSALKLSNTLSESYQSIMETSERMSTGTRLNSSMDGAADVAIANHFDVKADEIDVYIQNLQEGKTVMQVMEADLEAVLGYVGESLDKLKLAKNELLTKDEILAYVNEVQAMLDGTANISDSSSYKGIKLLDGTTPDISFEAGDYTMGINANLRLDVDYSGALTANSSLSKDDLIAALSVDMATIGAKSTILTDALERIGVKQDKVDDATSSLLQQQEGYIKTESIIRDADVAAESAKQIKSQVLYQTASNLFASMTEGSKSRAISIINSAGIY